MKLKNFTLTTIFLSIILLCAFTPFGFLHLGVVKATIIHIPVIIASIILGPRIGAFLGLAFGITSIWINTITPSLLSFAFSPAIPVLGTDQGSFWALIVAIVPRVILGFLPYYLYKALQKLMKNLQKSTQKSLFVTGLFSTFIHTFLVMGAIVLLFQDAYAQAIDAQGAYGVITAVLTVFVTNGLIEAVLAAFVVSFVVPPLLKIARK